MKNDWKKLLGYEPGREQKEMILAMVRDEGISIEEACAKFAMPPLLIGDEKENDYDNPHRPAIRIIN